MKRRAIECLGFNLGVGCREAVTHLFRSDFLSLPAVLAGVGLAWAVALAPMAAGAQAAAPAQPVADSRISEEIGAFRLDGRKGSHLRRISYRGQTYRPLNAFEFIHVKALGPMIGGQPVLLAVSSDLMGVGTLLISVQNDTPLARVLSPVIDMRDPDLGLAQPGRQDLLLFIAGSRALVTSTGQVLWFEDRIPGQDRSPVSRLVSVSPDNRSAALLLDDEIRLSAVDEGVYARVPFTKAMQSKAFGPIWDETYVIARQQREAGRRIDQRRLYDNMKAEWLNRNFRWQESKNGWQFRGQGLTVIPVRQER